MDEQEELVARNYQLELFKKCLKKNTIIFLPTGAGKTFVAIMVLKAMGADLIGPDHKVSFLLVNTVALVDQHIKYISRHTPFKCAGYSGDMNVDSWKTPIWHQQFENNQVLVMTSEIFAGLIRRSIINFKMVNLIIFDECHHAVNDHVMRLTMKSLFEQIMGVKLSPGFPSTFSLLTNGDFTMSETTSPLLNGYNDNMEENPRKESSLKYEGPRIIGLTATLLNGNCKSNKVMEEVENLEKTFFSKIATADGLEAVVGYATNPEEFVVVFDNQTPTHLEITCEDIIMQDVKIISGLKLIDMEPISKPNLQPLDVVDDRKKILNIMKDAIIHIHMFGPYGGKIACYVASVLLRRIMFSCNDKKYIYCAQSLLTSLGLCINRFTLAMDCCNTEKERIHKFSSAKVLKLFDILKSFKETSTEDLCGLVFVERRTTAKVLYHILQCLSKNDPDFSHLKPDFIVGNNSYNFNNTIQNMYLSKKNREVLNKFVNKETNLLCSSQVLEEGIDIPKCSIVCKFDAPKDYRSYIQSKGRARHKKSHYYVLVSQDEVDKFRTRYTEFQEVEQILNECLIGKDDERKDPSKKEVAEMYDSDELKPFYVNGPGSAYIDPVSAVSLLTRYCQSLQADPYTIYEPEWYHEQVARGTQVTVYLPTVCPIVDPIKGIPMNTKKMAKRAAALEACIQLYKVGEITESILPKEKTLEHTNISFLFEHYPNKNEKNAGKKNMTLHDLEVPTAISGMISPDERVYLHIINLELLFNIGEDETKLLAQNLTYGFITPNYMPNTCSFPLYPKAGTVNVSILNNVRTISLSSVDINAIKRFHMVVFNDVLSCLSPYFIMDHTDSAESLFVVPVNKEKLDIDYEILFRNQEMVCVEYEEDIDKLSMVVNEETYLNKMVYPRYRIDIAEYLVLGVSEDKTPMSNFPNDSYISFWHYYQDKYSTEIVNKEQPLLWAKTVSNKTSLYKPVGQQNKRKWEEKKTTGDKEYLVPEMLGKREFPAELWVQGRFLPCIIYRLTFMLRVEQLWRKIGRECGFTIKETNLRPLRLNQDLLHYQPALSGSSTDKVEVNDVEEVEAVPLNLMKLSKDDNSITSLEESRYPWKDIDEPKDIERTLDLTTLDIFAYCKFLSRPASDEDRKEIYRSPKKYNYPALTYDKEYIYFTISMLFNNKSGIVELADMYEALTTPKANDIVNLERLETLGDSYLKFITTLYITRRFPKFSEGEASMLKGRMISNKNLFYLARKHNIGGILRNKDLRLKNGWMPPGFCIPEVIRNDIGTKAVSWKILNTLDFTKEEMFSGSPHFESFIEEKDSQSEENVDDINHDCDHYLKKQFIKDKCVADAVEAILGTYLLNTGMDGALKLVQWIGVIPISEEIEAMLQLPVPSPAFHSQVTESDVRIHIPLFRKIEDILGYKFKDKSYLLQAFTHASYSINRLTPSYEKLEFLGDAILDFLITCFIFELCGNMTPGDLTDLRSALVNNNTFASFVVRLGLHKYILMMNSKLQNYIDNFVDFFTVKKNFVIDDEVLILLEEDDLNLAEYVDVPKVLGDLFEAIAGAIYLDSNCSLETVWTIFYPIMWKEIALFSVNVPKNAVRRLYEMEAVYPRFGKTILTESGNVMVKLNFLADGRPKYVYGFGSNKASAKKAAAKIALRNL